MSSGHHWTSSGIVKGHDAPWLLCFHMPCVNMLTSHKAMLERKRQSTSQIKARGHQTDASYKSFTTTIPPQPSMFSGPALTASHQHSTQLSFQIQVAHKPALSTPSVLSSRDTKAGEPSSSQRCHGDPSRVLFAGV